MLLLEREVSESANVHVPWWVEGHGLLALSTGTLMEQPTPYLLPVELARGTVNQLRNQLFEWQTIGLAVPPGVATKLTEAIVSTSVGRPCGRTSRTWRRRSVKTRSARRWTPRNCWPRPTSSRPSPSVAAARGNWRPCWAPTWRPRCWTPIPPGSSLSAFNAAVVPISLARRGGQRGGFLLDRLRRADPVVPHPRAESLRRPAGQPRRPQPARLALSLGRRFRKPAGVGEPIHQRGGRPLSRQSRPLAMRGPAQHRRDALALGRGEAAIGRADDPAGAVARRRRAGADFAWISRGASTWTAARWTSRRCTSPTPWSAPGWT